MSKSKNILIVSLVVVVVGGSTYYFTGSSYKDKIINLENQIAELQDTVAHLSELNSQISAEEMAKWETYSNDTYGYSIKHASGWTIAKDAGTDPSSPNRLSWVEMKNKDAYGDASIAIEVQKNTFADIDKWAADQNNNDLGIAYDVSDITMGGVAGKSIYTVEEGETTRSAIIKGDNLFIIHLIYSQDQENISELDSTFQSIVSTFELK